MYMSVRMSPGLEQSKQASSVAQHNVQSHRQISRGSDSNSGSCITMLTVYPPLPSHTNSWNSTSTICASASAICLRSACFAPSSVLGSKNITVLLQILSHSPHSGIARHSTAFVSASIPCTLPFYTPVAAFIMFIVSMSRLQVPRAKCQELS